MATAKKAAPAKSAAKSSPATKTATKQAATGKEKAGSKATKPAAGGSWLSQAGWGAAKSSVDRAEKNAAELKNKPRRFWLTSNGADEKIIFVDDAPMNYREHEFAIGGDWKNRRHKTCLSETGDHDPRSCPSCAADNRGYSASALTIIHICEYKGRDGKMVRNPLRLFVAKTQAVKILAKHAEKLNGDLTGCVFEVSRTGEKSPSVGDMFTFVERVKLNDPKVLKRLGYDKPPKPYNYEEVLKAETAQEMKDWLSHTAVTHSGSGGGSADTGSDDDVPF